MWTGWRKRFSGAVTAVLLAAAVLIAVTPTPATAVAPASIGFGFATMDTGGYGYGVQIADVTGDGRADLIVTNHETLGDPALAYKILVHAQQVDGTLAAPAVYAPSFAPTGSDSWLFPATGDLDDDGYLDLVVGHEGGLEIFYQDGGAFGAPTFLASPHPVHGVEVVDLNADGRDDIAYSLVDPTYGFHFVRRLQSYANTMAGAGHIAYSAAETFAIGDVNADGRPDIVVEDPSAAEVLTLVNNGLSPLAFNPSPETRVGSAESVAVGDVTGDGRRDLIVASATSLSVLAGLDGGTLADPVVVDPSLSQAVGVEVTDMNGDARADVIVFSAGATRVYLQDDSGGLTGLCSFGSVVPSPYGGRETVAIGDLTGDGRPDAAGAQQGVVVSRLTQLAPGAGVASETQITVGPDTVAAGQTATFSGLVLTPVGACVSQGSISIERENPDGSTTPLGTAPLALTNDPYMTFSFEDEPPAVGDVAYRATWAGDAFHAASTSSDRVVTVTKRASSLSLALSDDRIAVGQSSTLIATLVGGDNPAQVAFFKVVDGVRTNIGSAAVGSGGRARFEISPQVSTAYVAKYAGSEVAKPSQSQKVTLTVNKRMSSLSLKVPRIVDFGEIATLAATLTGGSGTRTVKFYAVTVTGTRKLLGSDAANASGVATFVVKPSKNSTYVAVYAGNASWARAEATGGLTVRVSTTGAMVHYSYKKDGVAVFDCCRAYFAFAVAPNHAGLRVRTESQYLTDSGWRSFDGSVSYFELRANSTYEIYTDIEGGDDFRFRIRACAPKHDDHAGSCSKWAGFRFQ